MTIFTIKPIPKYDENVISLSQVVKMNSATVKAEEILVITNATIINYCYEISPKSLIEKFILKYRNYNHMKWFRAYRQLRDADTNNKMAVEAITHKDYREDRLTTIFQAERFDNTDASRSAKKSGLRTAIDKHRRHYHLVRTFDNNDSSKIFSYQTGKEIYWKNGKDS
ncbi:hypothetical protein GLOIN_2v1761404 [Rhizophagus clarus]|uniref:Uncharacterized protein n=2 Tax=Rhizophagus clarus TaxID=94130 RepID=A0A8H3R396_9GLOM|nr:hypothetical protein GLOIN_2v1761404 [Rhizophagus clarus]